MNDSLAVFLLNDSARAVKATYEADEKANKTMFKTLDPSLRVGDLVVVPTDTRHKMTIVKIVEVDVDVDFDSDVKVAWIVCKVDAFAYENLMTEEALAMSKIRSAQKAKQRRELASPLLANTEGLENLSIASIGVDRA